MIVPLLKRSYACMEFCWWWVVCFPATTEAPSLTAWRATTPAWNHGNSSNIAWRHNAVTRASRLWGNGSRSLVDVNRMTSLNDVMTLHPAVQMMWNLRVQYVVVLHWKERRCPNTNMGYVSFYFVFNGLFLDESGLNGELWIFPGASFSCLEKWLKANSFIFQVSDAEENA